MRLTSSEVDFNLQLKRGELWESLIIPLLRDQGFLVVEKSITATPDLKLKIPILIEAKYKDRMKNHDATGFAHHLWTNYKKNPNTFIIFCEPSTGEIYGQFVDELQKNIYEENWHISRGRPITVFKLGAFRHDWIYAIKQRILRVSLAESVPEWVSDALGRIKNMPSFLPLTEYYEKTDEQEEES